MEDDILLYEGTLEKLNSTSNKKFKRKGLENSYVSTYVPRIRNGDEEKIFLKNLKEKGIIGVVEYKMEELPDGRTKVEGIPIILDEFKENSDVLLNTQEVFADVLKLWNR